MSKKTVFFVLIGIFAVLIIGLGLDVRLETPIYEVNSGGKTAPFKLCFISDLHGDYYGKEGETLLSTLRAQNPNYVIFGGDVIDDQKEWDYSLMIMKTLAKEYPCFYAVGNHEIRTGRAEEIKALAADLGITVLGEETGVITLDGINFYGYDGRGEQNFEVLAAKRAAAPEGFDILVAHWPEDIEYFSKMGFELVLSGHAHGGQWRLPFFQNGLYAPGQGFFPKYSGGYFKLGETELIVSRGLAKESTPIPRIFNPPELVFIEVK